MASGTASGSLDGSELDQPDAVGELVGQLVRADREGEPGLAHAADTGEGHELVGADQRRDRGQLTVPPDEGRRGPGQVACRPSRLTPLSLATTSGLGAARSPYGCLPASLADRWGGRDGPPDAAGVRRGPAEPRHRRARRRASWTLVTNCPPWTVRRLASHVLEEPAVLGRPRHRPGPHGTRASRWARCRTTGTWRRSPPRSPRRCWSCGTADGVHDRASTRRPSGSCPAPWSSTSP